MLSYTKETFAQYKASGYNRDFFEAHRDVLTLRRAAKEAFNEYKKKHGKDAKLPSTKELSEEYSAVLERKKKSYSEYRKIKTEMQDWLTAQKIVQTILGEEREQEKRQEQLRQEAQEQQENR